jgi:hypothetical protein
MSTTPAHDLAGKQFGRLTAIERVVIVTGKSTRSAWRSVCSCGTERTVTQTHLLRGVTKSCGCLQRERRMDGIKVIHGLARLGKQHPLLGTWKNMIARCYRTSVKEYPRYGGRGITVCDRWRFGEQGKHGFECFIEDMGPKPSPRHSIDRIENNGGYESSNCRWATPKEQNLNTRIAISRALVADLQASGLSAADIAHKLGKHPTSIVRILKELRCV